jgi:zinc/manganese transport system substrate-binding protein
MRTCSGLLAASVPPAAAALLASACSSSSSSSAASPSASAAAGGSSPAAAPAAKTAAIGAGNEYADVISRVGGRYVRASAIPGNPDTGPHTSEAGPAVARTMGTAKLMVRNGVGCGDWATAVEDAGPGDGREVVNVRRLLGLPDGTPGPHLWYTPSAMPAVANAAEFTAGLSAWNQALAAFKPAHPDTPVAATGPAAGYMLRAAGAEDLTPWSFQAGIMNDADPAPRDVTIQKSLFTGHKAGVFLYSQQVTGALTESCIKLAGENGIPVAGVHETMPAPGYTRQSWMEAGVSAMSKAVASKVSAEKP